MNISELSVRKPVTILVLTALLVGLSAFIIPDLAVALYPSVTPPYITVSTSYSGAGPYEVEENITSVLEKEISNVSGLKSMSSTSKEESSRIYLEFDYKTDLDEATSDIRDSLERVTKRLPDDAESPVIYKRNTSSKPIMDLIIQGNETSEKLKTIAEDTVQPLLERLDGVSSAEVRGGETKVIRVDISQSRLEAYRLSLSDVSNALVARNIQSGAGSINQHGVDYTLRVDERYQTLDEIRRTVVDVKKSFDGASSINRSKVVRLEDIAEVYEGKADKNSLVYVNGLPSIKISIQNESDSNTVQVSEQVKKALPQINKLLPEGVSVILLYDDTTMISSTLDQVYRSAVQGALLAMLILFIFLRLENIYRYRERGAKLEPAAILGSREMITPIIASTLTTLCVFIPLIIWKDNLEMMGQLFEDMIFTVVISLIISLVTAVTLVPALSSHYLKLDSRKQKPLKNRFLINLDTGMEKILGSIEKGYRKALGFTLKNRSLVLCLIVLLFIISIQLFESLGMNFQPRGNADDKVTISLTMPVGTSLERTELFLQEMRKIVESEIKGYENLILTVGSSHGSGGTYTGSLEITLPNTQNQIDNPTDIKNKLSKYLNQFPEATFSFSSGRRMQSSSPVDVEIHSDDLDLASQTALEIRDLLKENISQVVNPVSSMEDGGPEYRIHLDTERASALGITTSQVATTIQNLIDGDTPTTFWIDGEELDVVVALANADETTLSDLESQMITSSTGQKIPLANLATLEETIGPTSIYRENETRIVHVTADLADNVAVTDIQPVIENLIETQYIAPEGVSISYGGEADDIEQFSSPLIVIIIVAIIMVFAVMASLFESLIDPFIIFFSIPLLLIGVVAVYKITGESFSVISAVGIIVLVGIVVNNGIVLVDYTNLLRNRGEDLIQAILNASQNRLRPILMTSLTTILGMIPMAFFPGEGTEYIRPIGQTIVGGLAVSTIITLFMTPVMYSILNARKRKKHIKQ